jgi:uncharacterized protein (TIGR02001 family)
MRKSLIIGLAALATTTILAAPAQAAELGGGFNVNGGATIASDYRFRGISQTFKNVALQGTMSVSHESGFYATVWGSTIDDYVAAGGDVELDLIAGYKHTFGGTTVDVGVLYYYYPGSEQIIPGLNTDFIEPYASVSHTFGPVTAKATVAYAPKQSGLDYGLGEEDGLYLAGDLSGALPGTPVALTGHIGHSFSKNYITFGEEYTDWSIGASYTTGPLTIGVQYVDTNENLTTVSNPFAGSTNLKNISKAGIVGSIGVAF